MHHHAIGGTVAEAGGGRHGGPPPSPPRAATISRRELEEGCFHAPVPFGETLGRLPAGEAASPANLLSFAAESSAGAGRRVAGGSVSCSRAPTRCRSLCPRSREGAFPWVRRTTTGVSRTAWGAFQGRKRWIILVMHARVVHALLRFRMSAHLGRVGSRSPHAAPAQPSEVRGRWGRDPPTRRPARPTGRTMEKALHAGALGSACSYRGRPALSPELGRKPAVSGHKHEARGALACVASLAYLPLRSACRRRVRSSPHPLLPYSLPSSLPTPPPLLGALCCAVACALKRSAQSVCVCARARVYGMCAERFGSHARSPVRVCYPWVWVWVCGCLGVWGVFVRVCVCVI